MSRIGAFHYFAAERIRPVEDDKFLSLHRALNLHRQCHRPDESVIAAADILEIANKDVDILELFSARGARSPYKL